MICLFLADGFEEIEALATVDILRRAGLPIQTVGVGTDRPRGSHGITVDADISESALRTEDISAVILPGGIPGTPNLAASAVVQGAIRYAAEHRLPLAAICAAPSILGQAGLLDGKTATCYPGYEDTLIGANPVDKSVVSDGNITTGRGAGVAVEFALELVARMTTPEKAAQIRSSMQCR